MRKKFIFIFSASIFLYSSSWGQRQHLLFENSFEGSATNDAYLTGTIGGAMHNDQHCCSYSIQKKTNSPTFSARAGTGCVRFELHSTDPPVSQSIRAELTMPNGYSDVGERWYGFSYYFEDWLPDAQASHELQFHPNNGTGAAVVQLRTTNNQFAIVRWMSGNTYYYFPLAQRTVVPNVWVDLVFHIKWAADNTGFLQVWKNGVLVVNVSNIQTSQPEGQYIKIGINNFSWYDGMVGAVTQRIFYVDEVRVGDQNASYCDVAPSCTALPVTLMNLSASSNGRNISLKWNTSSEINNKGFDVMRSTDGVNWTTIGFVAGAGNSNAMNNYTYVDDNLNNGRYYYKLKQIDSDERFVFSMIVSAVIGSKGEYMLGQNYPNPFTGNTTIHYTLPGAGQINISLFDINGKVIRVLVNGFMEAGTHAISFDKGSLSKGVYYYKMQTGDFTATKKMIIQ